MKFYMKKTLSNEELECRASLIKYFFSDVDGTLTDGVTYYSANGEELKRFSHVDGTGFHILKNLSIKSGVITGENSMIVKKRAEKLNLEHCYLGINDKLDFVKNFVIEYGISIDSVAYIGDDLNDLSLIKASGLSFATANAHKLCKDNATFILQKSGGEGAFREAVELLTGYRKENVWEIFNKPYEQ